MSMVCGRSGSVWVTANEVITPSATVNSGASVETFGTLNHLSNQSVMSVPAASLIAALKSANDAVW